MFQLDLGRRWLLACLCAGGCAGTHAEPVSVPSATIQQLIATAASEDKPVLMKATNVPPEFGADALLKTAPHAKPQARKDMLAVAWALAERAPKPFPTVAVAGDTSVGTIADRSDPSRLDRLSLQSAVIVALADFDAQAAQAKFQRLSLAPLPPHVDCDAAAIADPMPYYDAADAVLNHLQGASRKQALVLQLAAAVRNATQIAPLLRLARDLPRQPVAEQARLATALSSVFDRVRGDDPMFSRSSAAVIAEFPLLLGTFNPGDIGTAGLKNALRNYLLAHFQAPRCKANVEGEVFAQETQDLLANSKLVGVATDQIADLHRASVFLDLHPVDRSVAVILGEEYYVEGWRLAQRLLDEPDPAASKPERVQAARDFFDSLRFAGGADTSSFDRYRSRVGALRRLAELLPDDEIKQAANQTLFELVEASPLYAADRSAWFQDAKVVLDRLQDSGSGDSEKLARKMITSINPVFRLYGELSIWGRRMSAN